ALPVGPRQRRREALAAEARVGESRDAFRAPNRCVEQSFELGALRVVQEQEVDLVRKLMLDDAPRETTGVEQVAVQPNISRRRVRVDAASDVNRDALGEELPVEG